MESMCGVADVGAERSGLAVGKCVYFWSGMGQFKIQKFPPCPRPVNTFSEGLYVVHHHVLCCSHEVEHNFCMLLFVPADSSPTSMVGVSFSVPCSVLNVPKLEGSTQAVDKTRQLTSKGAEHIMMEVVRPPPVSVHP